MTEIWKSIPGYPEYEASTKGRIRSIERIDTIGRHNKGTILRPSSKPSGYLMVNLRVDGRTVGVNVSRIIALTFIPNPENKPEVNHINSVRYDNEVENLRWFTKEENTAHRLETSPVSIAKRAREETTKTKQELNVILVESIRYDLMHTTMKFQDIAKKHGKANSEISRCNTGERYYKKGLDYPLRKKR